MRSVRSGRTTVISRIAIFRHVGESSCVDTYDLLNGIAPAFLRGRRQLDEERFQDGAERGPLPERTLELGFRDGGFTQRLEIASVCGERRERNDHGYRRKQVSTAYAGFAFAQQELLALADRFYRLPTM